LLHLLCTTRKVRDAFRRHMAAAPAAWNWAAADVPSPLTDELEAAQASKKVRAVAAVGGMCTSAAGISSVTPTVLSEPSLMWPASALPRACCQADKRARQKAKDAARRDKEGGGSASSVGGGAGGKAAAAGAAAAGGGGGGDSFDDELAAAMAEAAAISSRCVGVCGKE
jgi:hypothetical protein